MATILLNHKEAAVDRDALHCPKCGKVMGISRVVTRVADTGIKSNKTYECVICGTTEVVSTALRP